MSDSLLRRLKRRWQESGSVGDEVRYLSERIRTGDLDPAMLELAAYCGHEASCLIASRFQFPSAVNDLRGWARGLGRWGRVAVVRALLALARLQLGRAVARWPAEALSVAEQWLDNPEAVDQSTIEGAAEAATHSIQPTTLESLDAWLAAHSAARVCLAMTQPLDDSIGHLCIDPIGT